MPIYEFACGGCGKRVEIFQRTIGADPARPCPHCGKANLRRLVSRFAVIRSGDIFGSADEEGYIDGLDNEDPRAIAAWARRMQRESGEEMGPEFDKMVSRMEAGEIPEDGFGGDNDDLGGFDEGGFDE